MARKRAQEPLIDRYYGLMLGFFLHVARLAMPEEIYESHRSRIVEVMRELGVEHVLPQSHAQFVGKFASIVNAVVVESKRRSTELADFFAFGFHSVRRLVGLDGTDRVSVAIRSDFDDIIGRYGLDGSEIEKILRPGWDEGRLDDALWSELVGRFYRLATVAIWPLKKQDDVCFVIMPFGEPFRGYYLDFYRPALRRAGYQSIRAWVGLTNELYLILLATVISRCSAALADVSAQAGTKMPNLNVIHEIGLNMGLENQTFLIRNTDEVMLPSNFTGLAILQYDPTPPDFPAAVAEEVGARLQR
jgi:hypothetical protein